ncbi:hypothetical protein [Arthrobacter sp. YN]|uniref:hypothetical protein n=1 Tax=Arthrobacter sp. YN TaxID=2020486 RepID=UPI000B5FFA83|nr:hypothetical protein [Arthrobacter sp. YN]ASN18374.1 hypothetical protein CGK93_00550 [Arthrobacter sp. YN]
MTNMNERARLQNWLEYVLGLIRRVDDLYRQEASLKSRYDNQYQRYLKTWGAGMYFLWTLILTLMFSAFVILVVFTTIILPAMGARDRDGGLFSEGIPGAGLFLLPLPVALIGAGIILFVLNSRVRTINEVRGATNARMQNEITVRIAPELVPINRGFAEVRQALRQNVVGHFPVEYLYEDALSFCIFAVANFRANSITEAIGLYENELHRQRTESYADSQLQEQRRAARVARINGIINGMGHATSAIRTEDAATRSAMNANIAASRQSADQR